MDFKEYDSAMARVYELGSYAVGHQHFPASFFRQAELPIFNGKPVRWLEGGCCGKQIP